MSADYSRRAAVKIIAWIGLVALISAAIVKICTKFLMIGRLQRDDLLIFASTLFAVGQVIAVGFEVDASFGRRGKDYSSTGEQIIFGKAALVSDLFYFFLLFLGRLAILDFYHTLSGNNVTRKRVVYLLAFTDTLWVVISALVAGFAYPIPRDWLSTSTPSVNQAAFWTVYGSMNVFLDVALAFLPYYILRDLQLSISKKAPIIRVFLARLLSVPLIVLRIVFIYYIHSGGDFSYQTSNAVIVTEIHISVTVILSCIPFLRPILDSLPSGVLGGHVKRSAITSVIAASTGKSSTHNSDRVLATIRSVEPDTDIALSALRDPRKPVVTISSNGNKNMSNARDGSTSSREPIIIQQTTTVTFEEEEVRPSSNTAAARF